MQSGKMVTRNLTLILIVLCLVTCKNKISGQDLINKLSSEVCQCIEISKYKNATEIKPCFDIMFNKHYDLIKEYYKTNNLTDSMYYNFGNKIAAKTTMDRQYIRNTFPTGQVGEKRAKQTNVECKELRECKFYYLTQRPSSKIQDTTFVTISKDKYLEKMRNKTTYSVSKIIWKSNCSFSLIFEYSDDPFKKEYV